MTFRDDHRCEGSVTVSGPFDRDGADLSDHRFVRTPLRLFSPLRPTASFALESSQNLVREPTQKAARTDAREPPGPGPINGAGWLIPPSVGIGSCITTLRSENFSSLSDSSFLMEPSMNRHTLRIKVLAVLGASALGSGILTAGSPSKVSAASPNANAKHRFCHNDRRREHRDDRWRRLCQTGWTGHYYGQHNADCDHGGSEVREAHRNSYRDADQRCGNQFLGLLELDGSGCRRRSIDHR